MPIYEYHCSSCGNKFEELLTRAPEKTLPCPSCKSSNTEKIMSVFGGINMVGTKSTSCPSAQSCASSGNSCSGCCPMN
ncbi:MAG: zinc ribbon domain-containing protein [Chitinivibrionales bacterium]|nr:zinc ribbon domain-containing protein [Chitinivibrionales bacterium]MBD3358642.1 zinc ribbon domain-containing protein [Chitinivibrionales bacterium]